MKYLVMNQVTSFFSAASSGISPIRAFTLGCSASTVLVSSSTDIEYLGITATMKRSNHLSHFIAGDFVGSDQNRGNPGSNDGWLSLWGDAVFARSAML